MNDRRRVHLVLAAGGMRAVAYAGAVAVLDEAGFEVASISAASAGSLYGAMLASGIAPRDVQRLVIAIDFSRLAGVKHRLAALPFVGSMWSWPFAAYSEPGIASELPRILGADPTFAQLQKPFATIGVDLVSRHLLVYSRQTTPDLRMSEAMRIAVSAPFMYPPHERDGRIVVDGALASPCPVWLAAHHDEDLPIVVLRPASNPQESVRESNLAGFLGQLFAIGGWTRDEYLVDQMGRVGIVDIPSLGVRIDEFGMSAARKDGLIASGRRAAEEAIPELSALVEGTRRVPAPAQDRARVSHDDRAEAGAARAMTAFNSALSGYVRDRVFISYSHKDHEWLDRIREALKPYVRHKAVEVWDDQSIAPGAKWKSEIEVALRRTRVAILLVTPSFLASDFVADEELPRILKAASTEGLIILWIAVRASAFAETPLSEFQAANDPSRPLAALTPAEQDAELVAIGKQVKIALS